MSNVSWFRRATAGGLLFWNALGCYTWKTPHVAPQEALRRSLGEQVMVETDFSRFLVRVPVLARDTIWGTFSERHVTEGRRVRWVPTHVQGIALADVTRVKVRGVSAARTSVAVLLGAVVVAGGITLLVLSQADWGGWGGGAGGGDSWCSGGWGGC